MSLFIQGMSSCLVQEIVSLGSHKTPLEAMAQFCKQTIKNKKDCAPNGGYNAYNWSDEGSGNKGGYTEGLNEHYVFHGVENDKENYRGTKNGYASRFAAFITENNLGNVHGGDLAANHRYHTDHICQVFVWNPDRVAVFKWWADYNKAAKEAAPAAKPSITLTEAAVAPKANKKGK